MVRKTPAFPFIVRLQVTVSGFNQTSVCSVAGCANNFIDSKRFATKLNKTALSYKSYWISKVANRVINHIETWHGFIVAEKQQHYEFTFTSIQTITAGRQSFSIHTYKRSTEHTFTELEWSVGANKWIAMILNNTPKRLWSLIIRKRR